MEKVAMMEYLGTIMNVMVKLIQKLIAECKNPNYQVNQTTAGKKEINNHTKNSLSPVTTLWLRKLNDVNPLAPELFFLILAHLYIKCE